MTAKRRPIKQEQHRWGLRSELLWLERTALNYPTFKRFFQISDPVTWLEGYKRGLMRRVFGFAGGPVTPYMRRKLLNKADSLIREVRDGQRDA